jgi:Trypsin-co-occurring domain 1
VIGDRDRRLVEYPLESGGSILVWSETAGADGTTVTRGLHDVEKQIAQRAADTFEAALAHIEPAARSLLEHFRESANGPSEINLEFGVNLHAQAGAVIAGTSGDANFKVSLTWNAERSPPS